MKREKYLRKIEEYSLSEIHSYDDILSVKHYKAIADACHDIQNYGIDYISIGFFTALDKPVFLSNMPRWSIAYNREGLWRLDTINTPKSFYLSGESHLLSELIDKNESQLQLYSLCEEFNIYEAFSILKSLGKYDLIIITHTRYQIIDPVRFYISHKSKVIKFTCIFIERIKNILQTECHFLKNDSVISNRNFLNDILNNEFIYNPLNSKETDTLHQASLGLLAKDIASALGVSIKSVNKSLEKARRKLNCKNTFQAVSKAKFLGILDAYINVNHYVSLQNNKLSNREIEAVYWTAHGYEAKEIARRMNIAFKSVQKYLASAQDKLSCKNKVELVFKAHILGFLKNYILKELSASG